ncbi:uncharacterized protein C8Q71DRAFT_257656 [Rhodofomes roseus]|uniref:Uncharacterized protein n=1 Tax=Rhodofomes roseus TaxID=34475 RepID=A0ABQ8K655_9APHY|nr:uncharacterized protein C8Q71DRAFT_257656 [Rhodofomes roseus]KAH9832536.1 hypothetical protein C8Q71DRAFT_257656 [Rhodofomes roseus]
MLRCVIVRRPTRAIIIELSHASVALADVVPSLACENSAATATRVLIHCDTSVDVRRAQGVPYVDPCDLSLSVALRVTACTPGVFAASAHGRGARAKGRPNARTGLTGTASVGASYGPEVRFRIGQVG